MRILKAIVACTVFLAAVTVSSAAELGKKVDSPPARPDSQTSNGLEMAEDLEIMGAVLRTALTEVYARPKRQSAVRKNRSSAWDSELQVEFQLDASAVPSVGRPDGAYLPDYGVVYQVTLDVAAPERRSSKDTAENGDDGQLGPVHVEMLEGTDVLVVRGQKADVDRAMKMIASGEWKDAARRLRGDPLAEPPINVAEAWQMPSADDLVDKLLDVLAENAGNFRHLKAQDRLTVAITFPRSKSPRKPADKSITSATISDLKGVFTITNTVGERSSHEVSGDLHMRQKNYKKAVEAYQNVLKVQPDLRQKAAIARKLIQAYVAAGDLKNAEKWIAFLKKQRPTGSDSQNDAPGSAGWRLIPLPARLVVSVPKSRLDEVAAGKMKPEELKGHATVDYFNPPADRPGLGSAKPGPSMGPGGAVNYGHGGYNIKYGVEYDGYGRGPSRPRGKQGTNR